jgi:hypothetical protein
MAPDMCMAFEYVPVAQAHATLSQCYRRTGAEKTGATERTEIWARLPNADNGKCSPIRRLFLHVDRERACITVKVHDDKEPTK